MIVQAWKNQPNFKNIQICEADNSEGRKLLVMYSEIKGLITALQDAYEFVLPEIPGDYRKFEVPHEN